MTTDDRTATGIDTFHRHQEGVWAQPGVDDLLGGRFLLRAVLGSGATGTVFSAIDTTVGQKVAIKLLHPELRDNRNRERLRREVRAARPGHPNIVSVFDLHEDGPHLYLTMELVSGRSLRAWMKHEGRLPIDRVVDLGRQVSAALVHLHGAGLVHRDVKPGNILISADGGVKLCDLGLARPLEEGVTVTETEMVVGTPAYMAPEQATGAELHPAADIYGLGLTLYQALTGEVPLKDQTAIATLARRQRERPPSVRTGRPDCPRWLDRLVRRMLEPNPRERPSAKIVEKALTRLRLAPRPRRRTVARTAVVAVLLVGSIVGGRLLTDRPTVTIDAGGDMIVGRDRDGRETWKREFPLPVTEVRRTDLDGDERDEILVNMGKAAEGGSRAGVSAWSEVQILREDGSLVSRFVPAENITWPFEYAVEVRCSLSLMDVDHNARSDAVLVCHQANFFPAVVFLYRPEINHWDQVLTHSGHIASIRPTPGGSPPGFRFVAVNNRLATMAFAGEILIDKDAPITNLGSQGQLSDLSGLVSPPFMRYLQFAPYRWSMYRPLPLRHHAALVEMTITDLEDGGLRLESPDGGELVFDRFYNLDSGPNAGRDLRAARIGILADFIDFEPRSQPVVSGFGLRREIIDRYASLLNEPAYRFLLDLKSSRAVAREGDLEKAIEILGPAVEATDQPDGVFRLAHFEALDGRLGDGLRRAVGLSTTARSGQFGAGNSRANYDGPQLALRIAIELSDAEAAENAIARLSTNGKDEHKVRVAEALRARAHLWWDRLQPEDSDVTSWAYDPAGDAIACLARWRLGASRPGDIDAMTVGAERNPDAGYEFRLARGAALLGANRNAEALDTFDLLVQGLVFISRDDFSNHQISDLALALRISALAADGQSDRARAEGAELLPDLTPNLLPAILVEEALEGAGDR